MFSWPKTRPVSKLVRPSYMCRSEPQMLVVVMRTRMSFGSSIRASGTSVTATSPGPWYTTAFMAVPSGAVAGRGAPRSAAMLRAGSTSPPRPAGAKTGFRAALPGRHVMSAHRATCPGCVRQLAGEHDRVGNVAQLPVRRLTAAAQQVEPLALGDLVPLHEDPDGRADLPVAGQCHLQVGGPPLRP